MNTPTNHKEAREAARLKAFRSRRQNQPSDELTIEDLREYFPLSDDRLELMLSLMVAYELDGKPLLWPPYSKGPVSEGDPFEYSILTEEQRQALRPKLSMIATSKSSTDGLSSGQQQLRQHAQVLSRIEFERRNS